MSLRRPVRRTASLAAVTLLSAAPWSLPAQATPAAAPSPASFMEAFTLAAQALSAEDYPRLRHLLQVTLAHGPENPRVLYHLARAEALIGDTAAAVAVLDRLAAGGVVRDIAADPAFAEMRDVGEFTTVIARIAAAAAPVVRSDTSFVIPDPDFIPEGIAYDPRADAFYVGSLHRGTIVRVGRAGAAREFARVAPASGQVVGMRVDADRRRLLAAVLVVDSAAPPYQRGPGAWGALHVYDLEGDTLLFRAALPNDGRPQLPNDVALAANGDAYVSESEGGRVFRLRAGAQELEILYDGDPNFSYPNGIALSADGTRLYVAHVEGISVLRPTDAPAARQRLGVAPGVPTGAFDGLYACGNHLLGIQSMLGFHRVVRLELSEDGRVIAQQALEQRHPAHDVPTTGTIAGDAFHYVANAQLGRLQPDHSIAPSAAAAPPAVLRLPLAGACSS